MIIDICLLYIDAVYQILRQFPIHFEFSSQFVTLFSQLAYSGQLDIIHKYIQALVYINIHEDIFISICFIIVFNRDMVITR